MNAKISVALPPSRVTPLDRCETECVEPERVAAVLERLPDERTFQDLAELDDAHIRLLLDVALQHVSHEERAGG
jgi:hypothetical protein